MLLERFDSAPIWPLMRRWLDLKPVFAWIPCAGPILDRDLMSGSRAKLEGGAILDYAGIRNWRTTAVIDGPRLKFENTQLNFASGQLFICMVLHTPFVASSRGSIVKLGDGTNGVGIAQGSTNDGSAGSELLILRESFAWGINGPNNLFSPSYSRLAFFSINSDYIVAQDLFSPSSSTFGTTRTINTPDNVVWVNGRQSGAYSYTGSVHAVFVYKFSSLSQANFKAFKDARGQEALLGYLGGSGWVTYDDTVQQFRPRRRSAIFVPAASAGPPTLTGISASGITSSGATLTITAS